MTLSSSLASQQCEPVTSDEFPTAPQCLASEMVMEPDITGNGSISCASFSPTGPQRPPAHHSRILTAAFLHPSKASSTN
jgi:hypothetical protein